MNYKMASKWSWKILNYDFDNKLDTLERPDNNHRKWFKKDIDLEEKSSDNCLISLYNMSAYVTNRLNFTIDMLVAFYLHT